MIDIPAHILPHLTGSQARRYRKMLRDMPRAEHALMQRRAKERARVSWWFGPVDIVSSGDGEKSTAPTLAQPVVKLAYSAR